MGGRRVHACRAPAALLLPPCSHLYRRPYRGGIFKIALYFAYARLETLEGPPLFMVEQPVEDGGLDLLIYDEQGRLVDVSYAPVELMDAAAIEAF